MGLDSLYPPHNDRRLRNESSFAANANGDACVLVVRVSDRPRRSTNYPLLTDAIDELRLVKAGDLPVKSVRHLRSLEAQS
jgi:hypothetical protein